MTKAKIIPTILLMCAVLSALASLTVPTVIATGSGTFPSIGGSSCLMSYLTYPVTIGACNPISGGSVSV
jgi:hypothetical protein